LATRKVELIFAGIVEFGKSHCVYQWRNLGGGATGAFSPV